MVSLTDALPSGMTFAALSAPADWTCSTPAAGAGGTVSCAKNSLAAGAAPAAFTLTVKVNANVTAAAILNTASVASATADPNQNNNSSAVSTTVNRTAVSALQMTDAPDPVIAGTNLVYALQAASNGPERCADGCFIDDGTTSTTLVSLTAPAGWNCTAPAMG